MMFNIILASILFVGFVIVPIANIQMNKKLNELEKMKEVS